MNKAQTEWLVVQRIKLVLEHAKKHILDVALQRQEPVTPAIQYAVRILDSRIRILLREWDVRYTINHTARERALIELRLNQDNGQIFELGAKKHRRGCLDCPACYMEPSETAGQVGKLFARVCQYCHSGIEHVVFQFIEPGTTQTMGWEGLTRQRALELEEAGSYTLIYQCESCSKITQSKKELEK